MKKEKKPPGRPPKADSERKAERIHVRVTVEEKARLVGYAEQEGLTISEYLLRRGLSRRGK